MQKELLQDETLAEKLVKRWFWLYIFSFLIAPSWYIIKLLISNDLSVAEVGIIYSIIWLIWILSNYNDLGFTESLQYFLPKFWINKKYDEFKTSIFLALWIQTFTAILIAILLWFGADWLATNYFHSPLAVISLKIFSLWFIVYNIFKTLDNIFKSFQDTFAYKLVDFIRMWSIVIFVAILFFSNTWSVLTYSLAWFGGTLVWLFVAFIIFLKKYKYTFTNWKIKTDKNLAKQLFSYSVWVVIWAQAGMLLWQIDLQMIIYFLWPQQAGYYTNYLSLLSIYNLILSPMFGFLFPVTTELAEKKQIWKLSLMINIFVKYFVIFWIYFWIFLAIFWPLIAFVLFWKKFVSSGKLLFYSWWFIFINILIQIFFPILAGLWKIKQRVKILWIAAGINFLLNLVLIPNIWIIWAIISTIIGWWIIAFLAGKEILKEWIKINIDRTFWWKNLALWIIFSLVGFFTLQNYSFQSRLDSLWLFLWVWLLYWIVILLVNWKEVRLFWKEVKKIKK